MKRVIIAVCIAILPTASLADPTPVADKALDEVTGQAGVSIILTRSEHTLTIDSLQWTDTDANGGTLSLNGIDATGISISPDPIKTGDGVDGIEGTADDTYEIRALTIDVVDDSTLVAELDAAMNLSGAFISGYSAGTVTVEGYTDEGIVRIGLPPNFMSIDHIGVDSITVTANGGVNAHNTDLSAGPSFGAIDISNVTRTSRGGSLFIFAH